VLIGVHVGTDFFSAARIVMTEIHRGRDDDLHLVAGCHLKWLRKLDL
jgi:hypothetical protein